MRGRGVGSANSMAHDEQDTNTDAREYEQRLDEASGMRVGPPGTGELDKEAVAKGDERWEQTLGSN